MGASTLYPNAALRLERPALALSPEGFLSLIEIQMRDGCQEPLNPQLITI